jgi:hypothetical protein
MADDLHTAHAFVNGLLDTLLLFGIFVTACVSVFKAGRWLQSVVSSVDALTDSHRVLREDQKQFRTAFDKHVTDEDARFTNVEGVLTEHGDSIKCVHDQVARLAKSANGKGFAK